MCKQRDIILVENFKSQGNTVGVHPFVVIDDEGGEIRGLPFDMICNVFSSFKSPEQRARKLSYPGKYPVTAAEAHVPGGNGRDGYIKTDQFYYFNKSNITYRIIGEMDADTFDDLIDFINQSTFDIEIITDNL